MRQSVRNRRSFPPSSSSPAQHRTARKQKRPAALRRAGPGKGVSSGELDAVRPRSLLAWLDLETDALPAGQRVVVDARVQTSPVEEVLLPVFGGDEAESTVGDQLLDGPCRHRPISSSRKSIANARSFREDPTAANITRLPGTDQPYQSIPRVTSRILYVARRAM